MGHHWPGLDSPRDDSSDDQGDRWSGAGWSGFGGQDYRRTPRRGPGGPPPWLQEILGSFGPPQRPVNRGPRVKRGDVRTAIIDVLHRAAQTSEPVNGYQVIQQIADLSGGEWRPSPGSVYPTIQQLQDEGLVEGDEERGRRTIRLTAEGTAWATSHTDELAAVWAPFERATSSSNDTTAGSQGADIKSEIPQVMSAVWQLATQGSEQQRRAALDVLVDTRRRLYGILADGRDGETR
jgi:DNA-binding PadR family transcriptional regulator